VLGLGLDGLVIGTLGRLTPIRGQADLLRAMDPFAFPSLNEGMGKAQVEAMYAGLPVVATRVGGVA